MDGSNNYVKQNSSYTISRHYYRRNWLSLFYLLIDVVITNVYIHYKLEKKNKKFFYTKFQEEIVTSLLYMSNVILRQRRPRPPTKGCNLRVKSVRKAAYKGHS